MCIRDRIYTNHLLALIAKIDKALSKEEYQRLEIIYHGESLTIVDFRKVDIMVNFRIIESKCIALWFDTDKFLYLVDPFVVIEEVGQVSRKEQSISKDMEAILIEIINNQTYLKEASGTDN